MALKDDLEKEVKAVFDTTWATRKGTVVPEAEDVKLGNDAVTFEEVAVLYADLAGSTELVKGHKDWFAAEVYKSFLHCAAKVIKAKDGVVTAFDGDRVMAVFIGDAKRSNAATAALKINGAVKEIINPAIKAKYTDSTYQINHAVGVDLSKAFVARTGVRGANDLVWVGSAPNMAAKMSEIRESYYNSYISSAVYERLTESAKIGSNGTNMWDSWWWASGNMTIYRSSWKWTP